MDTPELLFPLATYWWAYLAFTLFVCLMLVLDLGVFHRKAHEVSFKVASAWTVVWITLALLFNVGFYYFSLHEFQKIEGFQGIWNATPLFVALVFLEMTDIVFAVDSVPAIFALTEEPFIVFTSNIFAILGLRAMYFMLAGVMDRFEYLKYGLALVLIFVGMKMAFLNDAFGGKFPIGWSLTIIATLILGSAAISWFRTKKA